MSPSLKGRGACALPIANFPSRWGRPGKVARAGALLGKLSRNQLTARPQGVSLPHPGSGRGLPRLQEPASKIAGTRTIRGAVQPGGGEAEPGTPRLRLQESSGLTPLRASGSDKAKEAHLFPTLKNLVPMVT